MDVDQDRPRRRSLRLAGYDYAEPGAYFVIICTQSRGCFFGKGIRRTMHLNDAGRMIQAIWNELTIRYTGVETDASIVMPNHVHGIIVLVGAAPCGRPHVERQAGAGRPQGAAPTLSLPNVMQRFKTLATKRYADGVKTLDWPRFHKRLWQRGYYEHVIRDDEDLNLVREYIMHNAARWDEDEENPKRKGATTLSARERRRFTANDKG